MKIARRKRAQAGTGCFNPGDAKSASRTRLNQFSAGYFRAGSALVPVPPPPKGPAESGAEGGSEEVPPLLRFDALTVSVSKEVLCLDIDDVVVVGLGAGGNGLHDRPPLSAQGKGDFRPKR